jgi:hypothetical protein
MPRVKTISPGRLTGISGLAKEAAQGVKYNKDVEYAYELEKWKEQNEKILEVQKQEQDTISENLKLIAGKELGVDGFNESVRNQMMDLAVKTARANSKMKLGDLDPMEGAKEVASYENVLDVFQTSISNVAALSDKIINAPESGAGSILRPADPTQVEQVKNIVQIVTDMNSPERNSKVEYSIVDGKSMIKHKETGQEISLKGLNDIMSGKNPQYPIKFVPDFTQAAKSVVETMLKERKENFTKEVNVTTYDDDGTKRTVKKNKILTGDGSNYNTELTAAMDLMMNDKENMPGYWADLTKDLPVNEQTPWLNTDEQRKEAISLMYTAADNAWGPKTNVETTSETTVQQKPPSAFEIREQQQKETELRLREQKSKTEILELKVPKFLNQFKKEYTQPQQLAFEAALRSYKDMNILLDQLQDPEFSNKEGIINEEGIARANNFFPGIKGLGMEKVNTRLKLKTVLNQEFLKGDGKTEGLSINVFRVMNKDYEELLEKQDKAKYPTVEFTSDLNDKEIGSIVNYKDILYTIIEVGGKKQLEEKK